MSNYHRLECSECGQDEERNSYATLNRGGEVLVEVLGLVELLSEVIAVLPFEFVDVRGGAYQNVGPWIEFCKEHLDCGGTVSVVDEYGNFVVELEEDDDA